MVTHLIWLCGLVPTVCSPLLTYMLFFSYVFSHCFFRKPLLHYGSGSRGNVFIPKVSKVSL